VELIGINWNEWELDPWFGIKSTVFSEAVNNPSAVFRFGEVEVFPTRSSHGLAIPDIDFHPVEISQRNLVAVQFLEYFGKMIPPEVAMLADCIPDRVPAQFIGTAPSFFRRSRF